MAQGEWSKQEKAEPPSQPDAVPKSDKGLLFALHERTGWLTAAFPAQPQEGLQQSQYLVDLPEPEAA